MFQLGCDYCGIIGYGINLTVMEDGIIRGEKVLLVIITAGYENASRRYTGDRNWQRVEHQKQKHN